MVNSSHWSSIMLYLPLSSSRRPAFPSPELHSGLLEQVFLQRVAVLDAGNGLVFLGAAVSSSWLE